MYFKLPYESFIVNIIVVFLADPRHVIVGLKLKGPDNSLRVRQIRILGEIEGESLKIGKQLNTQTIQQRKIGRAHV